MPPHPSSSSDDILKLPRVPRVRRSATKDTPSASRKSTPDQPDRSSTRRTSTRGKRNDTRNASVAASGRGATLKRRRGGSVADGRRGRKRRSPVADSLHSDDDENEESEGMTPPARRGRGGRRRRGVGARKVVEEEIDDEEEDDDDDDDDDDDHAEEEEDDDEDDEDDEAEASIGRDDEDERKAKLSKAASASEKTPDSVSDDASQERQKDDRVSPVEHVGVGDDSARFESDAEEDIEEEDEVRKKPGRLTRRQRAMQGEQIQLEYTKLESRKVKKATPQEEEWSNDEEAELKRQQRARLRQMINEKRNKEKRAAMVDKVLRGVTSKRKKLTMASEERVAKVGTRLRENEMREGCIRFISNQKGVTLSIPQESEIPPYLRDSVKAVYPKACERDPRTGKRIFVDI
eukprot:GFKZ01009710.1.p3 GENE.GFKZ01009710.1~~GFKZ01009710.1.p3  ORF type:complete len:405 (-),score=114.37 GFKZ01009710.1:2048-3262(-)